MNFSDEEQAEFEQALEDTSLKALLVTQTQELREIRYQMQVLNDALTPNTEPTETLVCGFCGEDVPKMDQREHLKNEHNAPDSVPLGEVFL